MYAMKASILLFLIFAVGNEIQDTFAARSNRLIQRCGNDAREFLRWFCMDSSFTFPFPLHRFHFVIRYIAPYKDVYPFQHQASTCCRFGCPENGYQQMCEFHKKIKRCEKTRKILASKNGRRRRFRCRLAQTVLP